MLMINNWRTATMLIACAFLHSSAEAAPIQTSTQEDTSSAISLPARDSADSFPASFGNGKFFDFSGPPRKLPSPFQGFTGGSVLIIFQHAWWSHLRDCVIQIRWSTRIQMNHTAAIWLPDR